MCHNSFKYIFAGGCENVEKGKMGVIGKMEHKTGIKRKKRGGQLSEWLKNEIFEVFWQISPA